MPHDRPLDADVAHAGGPFPEASHFRVAAPEQLDQQRAADVERFVHHGVHLRVGFHLLAGDVAQARRPGARAARMNSGRMTTLIERQPPFEGEHDGQHGDGLDHVGDDADDGVADGVLRADHVVVQAAHQLADLGVGEEAQRHALQAANTAPRAGRRSRLRRPGR